MVYFGLETLRTTLSEFCQHCDNLLLGEHVVYACKCMHLP